MTEVLAGRPRLQVTGDPRHGVTIYARRLADALVGAGAAGAAGAAGGAGGSGGAGAAGPGGSAVGGRERVHVHFTDRLWGSDPASAAAAVEQLADRASVSVTLHDLPQPSDGLRNLERRAAAYRRVVTAASAVVCNSHHEAALLSRYVDATTQVTVIPLPVDRPGADREAVDPAADRIAAIASAFPGGRTTFHRVSVLGYIYPGKGHDRVIRAVASLRHRPPVVVEALGGASRHHEHDLESLRRTARYSGVGLAVTGFLPDAVLLERSRRCAVPVIAHRHVSASGSLVSWLAAGRRPLVLRSPYMQEMAELHRNALTLVDPRELAGAIEWALDNPASTWLDPAAELGPTLDDTAAHYRTFWNDVPW